ncbi:hypothetical protein ACFSCX_05855 [Bacillus salitolerans]|uniref:Uncharacterized protein n=1 Tax=Bacillus salitolerans TaxID=1437434 RepID=A0ABW4LLL9_9BACI
MQEYAVYKRNEEAETYHKFESITVSWMSDKNLEDWLVHHESLDINQMEGMLGGTPLKECNRYGIDHIISFTQYEKFQGAFKEFAANY